MMSEAIKVRAVGTAIAREEFGSRSVEQRHETASSAVVAQARALIEARYVMAERRPRDWDDVRTRLLRECGRKAFAARALYELPRSGKVVSGLSVRFAEAVIRTAGNIAQETRTLVDDVEKRLIKVSVTDLETNAVYERDVVLEKTIERANVGDRIIVAQRMNSANKTVYIVSCTDDELLQKESSHISKTFRTLALRFLPADILDECLEAIRRTRADEAKADPDAMRKGLADAFAGLGVMPSEVKTYLGHELASSSPAELTHLRGVYEAIRGGEASWAEVLAERLADRLGATPADQTAEGAAGKPSAAQAIADRVARRKAAANATAKPATTREPDDGEPPPDVQTTAFEREPGQEG